MAAYLSRDALRLPAARLVANSRLRVNVEFEIWLLLGVTVDTPISKWSHGYQRCVDPQISRPRIIASATIRSADGPRP